MEAWGVFVTKAWERDWKIRQIESDVKDEESGLREERAEERICLVRRLYDRGMNSAQISELIGLDKEQVEEMLQTKSNFENNG